MPTTPSQSAAALAEVDRRASALVDFASALIAAPSPTPPGDERAVAAVAAEHLRGLGLSDIAIVGPRPERANLICTVDTGRPGPTLILNGHLDTKPPYPLEGWETDPFTPVLSDGRLYGLGATDMKGPNAALAYGLACARAVAGDRLRGKVLLVLSADEEGEVMDGARYLVQERGLRADAVLVAEPCGVERQWETLPLISRGFCAVRFHASGTQMHSSLSDRLSARNASVDAARLLVFLQENLRLTYPENPLCPSGPTVVLGSTLTGGQGLAFVPGEAEFTANIRTVPGMTRESLARDIDACMAAFAAQRPRAQASWSFVKSNLAWTEPTQTDAALPLVGALQRAAEVVLGEAPPLGCFPGGTDAIWWQGWAGIPTIPAFGPGLLTHCHKPNEYIGVESLVQAAKVYALAILDYLASEETT